MMKRWISMILVAGLLVAMPVIALATSATGTVIIANGDSVRVRAADNADSEQIGLVNPGEQYTCIGIAPSGWYEIAFPTGESGFISNRMTVLLAGYESASSFSYPVGTVEITHAYDVNTRAGGGGEYAFMGSVNPGDTFPCVGMAQSGWYAIVQHNGWISYVSDELATLHADAPITPNQMPQSINQLGLPVLGVVTVTNDENVNVRTGGAKEYPVLAQVRPGDMYCYVGKFEGSNWLGIVLPDNTVGYVAPGMVELTRK